MRAKPATRWWCSTAMRKHRRRRLPCCVSTAPTSPSRRTRSAISPRSGRSPPTRSPRRVGTPPRSRRCRPQYPVTLRGHMSRRWRSTRCRAVGDSPPATTPSAKPTRGWTRCACRRSCTTARAADGASPPAWHSPWTGIRACPASGSCHWRSSTSRPTTWAVVSPHCWATPNWSAAVIAIASSPCRWGRPSCRCRIPGRLPRAPRPHVSSGWRAAASPAPATIRSVSSSPGSAA